MHEMHACGRAVGHVRTCNPSAYTAHAQVTFMSQARTLGILGGGQLGRMMAEAGHRLGVKCIVLDPGTRSIFRLVCASGRLRTGWCSKMHCAGGDESPAGQVTHGALKGSFRDAEMVKQLASRCDVLTVEIEHIDCDALEELEADGVHFCE